MICNKSNAMTHARCAGIRDHTCGRCPGPGTEILTFDEPTYEALRELAEHEGSTVAAALEKFITELATNLRRRVEDGESVQCAGVRELGENDADNL